MNTTKPIPQPVLGSFGTEELGSPPADAAPVPAANDTDADNCVFSFRTPREIRHRIKVLATRLEVPVQDLCTGVLTRFLEGVEGGTEPPT